MLYWLAFIRGVGETQALAAAYGLPLSFQAWPLVILVPIEVALLGALGLTNRRWPLAFAPGVELRSPPPSPGVSQPSAREEPGTPARSVKSSTVARLTTRLPAYEPPARSI